MGRSKRLREHANPRSGSRQAALDARAADNGFSQGFGVLQPNRLVRDTRRAARTENDWHHAVLFVVLALIIVAWALGY